MIMLKEAVLTILSIGVIACGTSSAKAADPKMLVTQGDWSAYVYTDETGNKVCYMAGMPSKDEGDYTRRGQIYALITTRPAEGTKNVFSYIAGYPYKPGSDATV